MHGNPRRLRRPEERVGNVTNADLPPPATTTMNDAAIVESIRRGESNVFEYLLEHFYSAMLRVATSFVRTREEAEEVIQDTWIAVLSGIDGFEGRSSFKTWMFRILINRARSRAKREKRTIAFSSLGSSDSIPAFAEAGQSPWRGPSFEHACNPEEHTLNKELRERIEAEIAQLPPLQRAVISLRDVEGWSTEEVCETLKISDGNQRVLLHRARMQVRAGLSQYLAAQLELA